MSRASQNANAVVRAVTDLLSAHKVWHWRVNTGASQVGRRFFRYGKKGAADIQATPLVSNAYYTWREILWVECKAGSGRQSPDQKAFQAEVEAAGHSYIIAHDGPEAVIEWLKDHGVI